MTDKHLHMLHSGNSFGNRERAFAYELSTVLDMQNSMSDGKDDLSGPLKQSNLWIMWSPAILCPK